MSASSRQSASRVHAGILGLGAVTVLGALARPLFAGTVFTASDLGNFYLPIRSFYHKALAAGHGVTWFPNEFTGFYLHGEGQVGLLHPLNLAQYAALPLEPAFNLELLRGYVALLVGAYLLLRRLALPRDASLLGAFLATFSSFTFLHYMHLNIVGAAAHLPWLLLAMLSMLFGKSRARCLLGVVSSVLLTGSLCMLGHPQFVFLATAVELFAFGCAVLGGEPSTDESSRPALGSALLRFGGAKVLGFAAAGIALVPMWESLSASFRAAPPEGFTSAFNITPLALIQLVAPYLLEGRAPHENLTEYGFYLGAVPTVLLMYTLALRGAQARFRLARAAVGLLALAFLLSLGDWGGLYRLQSWLPVVGLFRAPARYVLVVELAVALLAALAFADLAQHRARGRLSRRALAALFVPSLVGLVVVAFGIALEDSLPAALSTSWVLRAAGPVLLGLSAVLVARAAGGGRFALAALLVLAMADIGAYGMSFVGRAEPQTITEFLARYRVPAEPGVDRLHWGPPALTMKGFRLAGGYAAMTPDRVLDLGTFGAPLRKIDDRLANALRVSGVRWAIGTRVPEPLPRARLVTQTRVSDDPNRDIGRVDVATTALLDVSVALDPGAPGSVEIARDAPGEIDLLTNAPGRQLLVLAERHHEGWRGEVDGQPCTVHRAYGDYLACVVGPGRQSVAFRFAPSSLRQGAFATTLALCVTALWCGLALALGARPRAASENLIDNLS